MRRLVPYVLRPWSLPLIVLALVVPAVAAFAVTGPQLGLAVGAITVAALVVFAARTRYDEPIEVARSADRRFRLALVAPEPFEDPDRLGELRGILEEGERVSRAASEGGSEVLVLAPARSSRLDRWASDLARARESAREAVAVSLATLAQAGVEASGRVADGDVVQALEDELRSFAADEVAIAAGPGVDASVVEEVRRRLDRPVRVLGAGGSARGSGESGQLTPGARRAAG